MNPKWIPNGFHVDSIATAAVASARVCVCDRDTEGESEHKRMHERVRERERQLLYETMSERAGRVSVRAQVQV